MRGQRKQIKDKIRETVKLFLNLREQMKRPQGMLLTIIEHLLCAKYLSSGSSFKILYNSYVVGPVTITVTDN